MCDLCPGLAKTDSHKDYDYLTCLKSIDQMDASESITNFDGILSLSNLYSLCVFYALICTCVENTISLFRQSIPGNVNGDTRIAYNVLSQY